MYGKLIEVNVYLYRVGLVVIVYNGIIENFQDIKRQFVVNEEIFVSDIDLEVIVYLIYQGFKIGQIMIEVFVFMFEQLCGVYVIVVVCEIELDKVWVVCLGSLFVVGLGDGEMFFGFDVFVFVGWIQWVIYLEEGDWVVGSFEGVFVFDKNSCEIVCLI